MDTRNMDLTNIDGRKVQAPGIDFRRSDATQEERKPSETPEDVAVLYSWANLHGAKYRDFSASRREYRAQMRHRAAEKMKQEAETRALEESQRAIDALVAAEAAKAAAASQAERAAAEATAEIASQQAKGAIEAAFDAEQAAERTAAHQALAHEAVLQAHEDEKTRSNANMRAASGSGQEPVVGGSLSDPYREGPRGEVEHHIHMPASHAPLPAHRVSQSSEPRPQASSEAQTPVVFFRGDEEILDQRKAVHRDPPGPEFGSGSGSGFDAGSGSGSGSGFGEIRSEVGGESPSAAGFNGNGVAGDYATAQLHAAAFLAAEEQAAELRANEQRAALELRIEQDREAARRRDEDRHERERRESERKSAEVRLADQRALQARQAEQSRPAREIFEEVDAFRGEGRSSRNETPTRNEVTTRSGISRAASSGSSGAVAGSEPASGRMPSPLERSERIADERVKETYRGSEAIRIEGKQPQFAVPLGRPAWLYESEVAVAAARIASTTAPPAQASGAALGDTLQQSRERVASRWFALKGVFEGAEQQPEAQPVRQKDARIPVLALFSLAGGVGKTSMVATLGRALASLGEKTLLADTTSYGLLPFYFGARELRPGAMRTFSPPSGSTDAPVNLINLDVEKQTAEIAAPGAPAAPDWLVEEISRNARGNNRIVVDLATASGSLTRRILRMGPVMLVPVSPDLNSVISLSAAEQFFQAHADVDRRALKVFYVLNQFDAAQPLHLDVREVLRQQLGDRLLPFVIRRSPAVSEALAEGMTVMDYAPNSPVAEDYMNLATWVRSTSAPASLGFRGVRWSEQQ